MKVVFRTNWALAAAYVAISAVCAVTLGRSRGRSCRPGDVSAIFWIIPVAFFATLSVLTLFDVPETVRKIIKHYGTQSAIYEGRRQLQAALVAVLTVLTGVIAAVVVNRSRERLKARPSARLAALAIVGMAVELALVAARLISLHGLDKLLFGPAKIALMLDFACLALVAYAAISFARLPPPRLDRHR